VARLEVAVLIRQSAVVLNRPYLGQHLGGWVLACFDP